MAMPAMPALNCANCIGVGVNDQRSYIYACFQIGHIPNMNYNFHANWKDTIVPLLQRADVRDSMEFGVKAFLINQGKDPDQANGIKEGKYLPCDFMNSACMYEFDLCNEILKTMDIEVPNDMDSDEEEAFRDAIWDNEVVPRAREHMKTAIEAYQMWGACHWWNPSFGLTLAKIILPNEKWVIQKGRDHTTVTNEGRTLVFDILRAYVHSETLGGKNALEDSLLPQPDSWPEK